MDEAKEKTDLGALATGIEKLADAICTCQCKYQWWLGDNGLHRPAVCCAGEEVMDEEA